MAQTGAKPSNSCTIDRILLEDGDPCQNTGGSNLQLHALVQTGKGMIGLG